MALYVRRHAAPGSDPVGPPLLLVHGLGGDRHTWRPVLDALVAQRDVLVAELPGFGASAPLPDDVEPTPAALAEALDAALHELGVGAVHVAGVSLGGWVALELADRGRAATVVALAPAGFWPKPLSPARSTALRVGRLVGPALPLLLRSPQLRNGVLGRLLGGPGRFGYADGLALVRGYVRATDFERVNAAMRARTFDAPRRLRALAERLPVHVLWAGRDPLVVAPRAPLPDAVAVHRLPAAGHMPMFDEPAAVADLLLRVSAPAARAVPIETGPG